MMNEVLEQIAAFVDGKISREQFDLWFYDLSFDVEKTQPKDIVTLVHEVEGLLAEASSGGWSEDSLRAELRALTLPQRSVLSFASR